MKTYMNYTTKIKSWALALALVVTTLFAGSATAQTINVYNNLGGTFIATYSDLQTAINAAPVGGEVRILDGDSAFGFQLTYLATGDIVISQNFFLTAGAGGAVLDMGGYDLRINSNTVTLGSGLNNIDIDLNGGMFKVEDGASFVFANRGNTMRLRNGATVWIEGSYVTPAAPTDTVATSYVVGHTWSSNNASAGVYIEDDPSGLSGAGSWGNLYWAPPAPYTFDVSNSFGIAFADSAEAVFSGNASADFDFDPTVQFESATDSYGTFDVQFLNGGTINDDDEDSEIIIEGNLFAANEIDSDFGDLTVEGNFILYAAAAWEGFGSWDIYGNLTVENGAFTSDEIFTVVARSNVSDSDTNFRPNLEMRSNLNATSTLTSTSGTPGGLNQLVVPAGKTVNTGSSLGIFTTLSLTGSLVVATTHTFEVDGVSTIFQAGSFTKNGTGFVEFDGTVNNNGTITHNGSDLMNFDIQLNNNTNITTGGVVQLTTNGPSGDISIDNLDNNQFGVVRIAVASNRNLTIDNMADDNDGTIENLGTGNLLIDDDVDNFGTLRSAGGTFTVDGDVENFGQLIRTGGTFTIDGELINDNNAASSIQNSSLLVASTFGGGDYATRFPSAGTDGIRVLGRFTQNGANAYFGNVIVVRGSGLGGTQVAGAGLFGSLTTVSSAQNVTLTNSINIAGSLIVVSGTLNLAANNITMTGTGNNGAVDPLPNHGILMGPNTQWSNGMVMVGTSAPAGFGFYQASAGVPAGSFQVTAGQVQLMSNVNVSNITVLAGATVRKQFNTFCYDLVVAGTSTVGGAILECGTFAITSGATSIRAQLIANGYDPDNMNQSIQIAIGAGATIQLTDAGAEGIATQANWLGVTIVNTQSRFILSSGIVNLNAADLTLRGAFVYDGDWANMTVADRARITAQAVQSGSPLADTNQGGWLVFTGLNQPNADFIFTEDGVNSTDDGFVLRRLRFNRTGASPIRIVDNNNVNAGNVPSSVVVSERLEVNGVIQVGDNNIKWIGGNNIPYSASTLANRSIQLNTSEMIGSGFFWLANNHISDVDQNTINVNAVSGTILKMQLRADGNAGQRDYTGSVTKSKNQLTNIVAIGNGGMNYVRRGWLVTNQLATVDGDFTLGADQRGGAGTSLANLEVNGSLTFKGNLFIMDNNSLSPGNPKLATQATLWLVPAAADRVTTVEGIFQNASTRSASATEAGVQVGLPTVTSPVTVPTRSHNLVLQTRVILGAQNGSGTPTFAVQRPSRVVFASASANRTFEYVGGVTSVRIQRAQFSAGSTTAEYTLNGGNTMQINDLLLTNGLFRTNGGLAMVDLASSDPSWSTGSTNNLSIVTRDRTGSAHGQITRGLGSFGAYTSFTYAAGGGAPYTVQHIGSMPRFTGDEVPGLNVVNAFANANNSVLNRLVIDLAAGTEFELAKDLIVLTRIEALTGTVDIVSSAFLDIAANVQWVHGHAVLTDVAAGVIRFPNVANNTASNGVGTTRYDLLYVSKVNHTTGYEYKSGVGVRDLTVTTAGSAASPITLTLSENKEASGSVRVVDGVLNLDSKTIKITSNLIVDGQHNGLSIGAPSSVNNNGNGRVTGWFPTREVAERSSLNPYNYGMGTFDNGYGRVVDTNGTLEFVGTGNSYILGYVQSANMQVSLPNVVVTKTSSGFAIFEIDQAFTGSPDEDINSFNVLSFTQNSGTTHLRPGATFDGLPGTITTSDAPASGASAGEQPSVGNANFDAKRIQHWLVRQNMTLLSGNFYSWGATMTVDGNYLQGRATPVSSIFFGGQNTSVMGAPNGSGQWNSNNEMTRLNKQVNGNFTVLIDTVATVARGSYDNTRVHRYYLSNGNLGLAGNYAFDGHADITSGIGVPNSTRGFRGTVEFNRAVSFPETAALQSVRHVQNFRAFFENVVVDGRGIALSGTNTDHMWVNDRGVVTFALGNIVTGPARELILQNATVDSWLANEIISGAVRLSGSNSFVEGNLRRTMSFGGTDGGLVEDGYIFPLGQTFTANDAPAFSGVSASKRFYRPMTLQFPANLGLTINAVATSLTDSEMMIDPSLKVQGRSGTAQNPGAFYDINLTTTSDMYWNVKFNQLPALEPNIRLGVQGLLGNQNSNIDDMRIVTPGATQSGWRLAGVYDLTTGGSDATFNPNDFVDGMPIFIQEGLSTVAQQYNPAIGVDLRIGTNALSNPFDGPGTVAYLQVIHNSPAGVVDVVINGVTVLDDFTYQSATPFLALAAETAYNIEIKTANGASTLLAINGAVLNADQSYILIAQGGNNGKAFEVKVVDTARRSSTVANGMQYFFSHGVTNGPTVNVERVTTSTPRTLEQLVAVNAAYGSTTSYMTQLNPSISTLRLKAGATVVGQYLFDFGNYAGETMTLLATGVVGGAGANALMIIGVDADGNVVRPAVTTSDDENVATELPAEFTLNGNFPNPFNPTTNISFDLPEQANVRVEIVDLLGRQVMTIAPQSMSAGANKVITVDAARLSSGVYFYRVVAEGSTKTFVQGSKFTLVK